MTLSTTTNFNTYTGNGGANVFAFTYPVFLSTDIVVTVQDTNANITTLILGTDYTIQGLILGGAFANVGTITLVNSAQGWLSGGNLATGFTLTVSRIVPLTQTTSLRNQGDFFPAVVENELDNLVMQIQQLQQQLLAFGAGNLIFTDIVTGSTYRLIMVNGVLSTQQLS